VLIVFIIGLIFGIVRARTNYDDLDHRAWYLRLHPNLAFCIEAAPVMLRLSLRWKAGSWTLWGRVRDARQRSVVLSAFRLISGESSMSLRLEQVTKTFQGRPRVDGVSLEVQPGHIFGFLGPNGAGKTTTIRMILNTYHPDAGRISWHGQAVARVLRALWGYLPEERGLYPRMQVADQLRFLARLYGRSPAALQRDLDAWLERLQLTQTRTTPVGQLSKGNQQKIQFLAAILHDPAALLSFAAH
jgi:ABC-type glutathione transport system ATPase component